MPEKGDLLIVGAGGLGREVLIWAQEISSEMRTWEARGFLNSISTALDGYDTALPIICDALDFTCTGDEFLLCAIGDPHGRLKLCRNLIQRGARFISLIHPSAIVSKSACVGLGCIAATKVIIGSGAHIGAFVIILGSAAIGLDAVIGEGTTISAFSYVGDKAVIGERVFLGSHAIVMPGTIVGDGARIGARTVVSGKVPAGATFFGIPGEMLADAACNSAARMKQ
ncbi:MAG: hypothetical protein E4H23_05460 [Chrysiogenales bacterium]|nr:hypothetical protein [Candidatus Aminicenantes bacterium]TFG79547.1 MAG: hypothetical protein E4H23_05460 [Chrysiogenales bacterium]